MSILGIGEKELNDYGGQSKLAVCWSPLQAFLFIRIAKQKGISNVNVLYLADPYTKKDTYYINQLRKFFEHVECLVLTKKRLWQSIPELKRILQKLQVRHTRVDLYLASFNNFFCLYIANILELRSIFLFDDGVFSIVSREEQQSYLYQKSRASLWRRLKIYFLLGDAAAENYILNRVVKFYTMFPECQTLLGKEKVEPVELAYDADSSLDMEFDDMLDVKLFIGDVVSGYPAAFTDAYSILVDKLPINYYLPHPRANELYCHPEKILYLEMIAEEFVVSLLSRGIDVTVYAFASTVLFTLPKHAFLRKVLIKHPSVFLRSLYDLAPDFEIEVVDYDTLLNTMSISLNRQSLKLI